MSAIEKFRTPQSVAEIERLADHFAKSGLFGRGGQAQSEIIVKMIAGAENGFGPFASVQGIHVIQGRPEVGADLLARAVKESGKYDFRVREISDERCKIEFFQGGDSIGVSEFSMQDAQKAGLKKDMYAKYPRNMLYARAMSNGVGWFCPDAVSTRMYVNGEISGDAPVEPEVVVGEVVVEPQTLGMTDRELTAAGVANGDENARHAPAEPDATVAQQLAAIGADGRKRLKAHLVRLGVAPTENTHGAWVDAIIENFGIDYEGAPMYANLAVVLANLDEQAQQGRRDDDEDGGVTANLHPPKPSGPTPLQRQEASDRLYDDEAERLAAAAGLPMYGESAPS